MRYKRQKTRVSKYISFKNDKEEKKLLKRASLKRRTSISVCLILTLFTLTRLGVINRNTVKEVFVKENLQKNEKSILNSNIKFLDKFGENINEFCSVYLKDNESKRANAYTRERTEEKKEDNVKNSDAQIISDAKPEAPFTPVNPCAGRISSDFGERVHPMSSSVSFHNGIDIAANEGTEIRACFDGIIETSEFNEFSGNYIIIDHENDYTSSYAHMSKLLKNKGERVKKGDVIGYVGSTGSATGPHLHFEIRHMTTPVNPRELIENER